MGYKGKAATTWVLNHDMQLSRVSSGVDVEGPRTHTRDQGSTPSRAHALVGPAAGDVSMTKKRQLCPSRTGGYEVFRRHVGGVSDAPMKFCAFIR